MLLRQFHDDDYVLSGKTLGQYASQSRLYPSAYPFSLSRYGTVCPCALQGKAIGVTSLTDVWGKGFVRTTPTAAFVVAVSSSSVNDAFAGTGARVVQVDVIEDVTFEPKTLTINLNGQTKVADPLNTQCWRVNATRVISWGGAVTNHNIGDIHAYDSTSTVTGGVPDTTSKIFAFIRATENFSKQMQYTVPKGYTLEISRARGGITDTTTSQRSAILTFNRSNGVNPENSLPIWSALEIGGSMTVGNNIDVEPEFHIIIDEKSDIRFQVASSGAVDIVAYVDCILVPK